MLYCAFLHEKAKKYTLHLIRFLCQIAFFTIPGQKDSHAWREFGQGRKRPALSQMLCCNYYFSLKIYQVEHK